MNEPTFKNIRGRKFKIIYSPEHNDYTYEYKNKSIRKRWITIGYTDRWNNYKERDIYRYVIIGITPYHINNFTSVTTAAIYIDRILN